MADPARTAKIVEAQEYRYPYLGAAVATIAVWVLYAATLAPTTAFWDTSEYIATAHILGIPHPPGNPTFVVLARAWELLLAPLGLSVAARINLFSATMSALAHGCWFLVAHRIASYFTRDRVLRLIAASLAVLVSATAFTVWTQSNVNEKVYTVSLFTIALLTWLAFLWRDNLGKGKDDNLILLMVFILGLSVGNHLMAFLAAPAILVFILLTEPRTLLNWKLYAFGAAVVILGLSTHLFLPVRASLDPVINEADPSTWHALVESLARKQYDKPSVFANPTDINMPRGIGFMVAQFTNYLQYFDWQWARGLNFFQPLFGGIGQHAPGGAPIRPLVTLIFTMLGVYGAYEHYRRDRTSWFLFLILFATVSVGLVGYLNFKYGYTYPQPGGGYDIALHEVRERDYFFIVSFSVWGLWAGLGIFTFWRRIATALGEHARSLTSGRQRLAAASPVLLLAFIPLGMNLRYANRSHQYMARDWAYNMLMSVEPYGVLFTNGDNDTFPLWYVQEVEGVRRDVTVIVMSYLNTPWYAKQIKALTQPCAPGENPLKDPTRILCQRPFQPEKEAGVYARSSVGALDSAGIPVKAIAPAEWRTPDRSILSMSDARIDSIPMVYAANPYSFLIRNPVQIQADRLKFTISGDRLLLPSDVFMLNIIQNSMGDRPVYFATTTQAYDRVGLADHLVRQGLALKLWDGDLQQDTAAGIFAVPSSAHIPGKYVDLPATDALLWDVFVHRGGIPDKWDFWPEPSTKNIPWYYVYAHYAAYTADMASGRKEDAERHYDRMQAWTELAQK